MTPPRVGAGPALVVGLGSPDRGDDAVGPTVARRVATLRLTGIQVVEREDPTSLIELWDGRDLAVVVDAVCSNGVPGTLMIMESGVGGAPLTDDAWTRTGRGGTHAFGLAAAVELSRALHRLPRRLVLDRDRGRRAGTRRATLGTGERRGGAGGRGRHRDSVGGRCAAESRQRWIGRRLGAGCPGG